MADVARDPQPPGPDPVEDGGEARADEVHHAAATTLTIGALGVVFGDIGTSPLYAMATIFHADHGAVQTSRAEVYGVVSLIFWAITIVVSIKYLTFVMRADNEGEGGIMALIALTQRARLDHRFAKMALVSLGIFGAALFYGDGMITPAISVLSAVEGLQVADPSLETIVVPGTLTILTLLFAIQRYGTGAVGRAFGPVMALWFSLLAVTGVRQIVEHPGILAALSPSYGVAFLAEHGGTAFIALGSIVLVVTGAEALYADMGHFGRPAIRRAWFLFVFPALTLHYLGQASLIVREPRSISSPFFLMVPDWSRIPVVVLATAATVIASQAVISGAFSVTRQAVNLGFLPRLAIRHTSEHEIGQVYVPSVNAALFFAVVALVVGFGSSTALSSAYGIAVTGTLAIDTILFFVVVRTLWHKPLARVVAGAAAFLCVDLAFFSANLTKVLHGGWFPLLIALAVFVVLTTWQKGRVIVTRNRTEEEGPLRDFVRRVHDADPPIHRCARAAVFLNASPETTPLALRANLEHNHLLHSTVVIVSVETAKVPHVAPGDQVRIDELGYEHDGISHVTATLGFQDTTDVPAILQRAIDQGLDGDVDPATVSYFLSRMTIVPTDSPGMSRWRKRLFVTIARNAANPVATYFALPEERTVIVGSQVML